MADIEHAYDAEAVQALTRAYIACQLAQGALSSLPADVRNAVEEAVRTLCAVVGPQLEQLEANRAAAG